MVLSRPPGGSSVPVSEADADRSRQRQARHIRLWRLIRLSKYQPVGGETTIPPAVGDPDVARSIGLCRFLTSLRERWLHTCGSSRFTNKNGFRNSSATNLSTS